jgi:hypothetical protein
MAQLNSANWRRVRSVIPGPLVAQYAMPPFGMAIPNTFTNPNPGSHTSVPIGAIAVSFSARVPVRRLTPGWSKNSVQTRAAVRERLVVPQAVAGCEAKQHTLSTPTAAAS